VNARWVLAAEVIYDRWIREGREFGSGRISDGAWAPHGPTGPSWDVTVEVVPNAVWRGGSAIFSLQGLRSTSHAALRPSRRAAAPLPAVLGADVSNPVVELQGYAGLIARSTTFQCGRTGDEQREIGTRQGVRLRQRVSTPTSWSGNRWHQSPSLWQTRRTVFNHPARLRR